MATSKKKTKGAGSDEPFVFTTSALDDEGNPVVITVPSLAKLEINGFKQHQLRKQDPSGFLAQDYILRLTVGDDQADEVLEVLAELPAAESVKFQEDWSAHSGVSQGESRAS